MENTQKVIVILLVLAIVFSVISIVVSLGATNFNLPSPKTTNHVIVQKTTEARGDVKLFVEGAAG